MADSGRMLVVAIDFGTTYSGYAYSFLHEFQRRPLDVHTLVVKSGSNILSAKVPTSVLFRPDQQFHSFGVEAEENFARLNEDNDKEAKRWFYFERFKMTLHNNSSLSRDLRLQDKTKRKSLPALTVFSAAIKFLKSHFLGCVQGVVDWDIHWVLTVPALWHDQARHFMREAAEQAGIPGKQLSLALEPEAAAVYCQELCRERPDLLARPLAAGSRFMVVDCGGGTIDISVSEVTASGRLRQLHKPTGTADGGTAVDKAFKNFLCELVGFDGASSFSSMESFQLDLAFEETKRSFRADHAAAHVQVPTGTCEMFSSMISSCEKHSGKVKLVHNRLAVDGKLFQSFFQQSTAGIVKAMREVLVKAGDVDVIFLAGGFGESDVIQNAVASAFGREKVISANSVPESRGGQLEFLPVSAIMMGAVVIGHRPSVVASRVSPYTYGVAADKVFVEGVHDKHRRVRKADGKDWCRDCFHVHIRAGQELEANALLPRQRYHLSSHYATEMPFRVFRTRKEDPLYVDEDGCEQIGTMTVLLPDTTGGMFRAVEAAMQVGGTELRLVAWNAISKEKFSTRCDFLPSE